MWYCMCISRYPQLLLIPALIWQRLNQMFFGIFISPDAEIGPGMIIHTPYGIFIPPVKIGANCIVYLGCADRFRVPQRGR